MSIFSEDVSTKAKAVFSDWIQVVDNRNPFTLDNFSEKEGANELQTKPHCVLCTVVNKCWFKNEKGKKPDHFDYTIGNNGKVGSNIRGLYHPHCHCFEKGLNTPSTRDIKLIFPNNKVDYLFDKKDGSYYSWGYKNADKENFIKNLKSKLVEEYVKGNYVNGNYLQESDKKYGFKINIFITIEGINEKHGSYYEQKSGFIVYPNGGIRNLTPLVRRR